MNKVLVTGSSRGIGLEIALAFGRAGYQVFATMRKPAKAVALSTLIKAESLPIKLYKMNVDSDISVKAVLDEILLEHGPIDILVNNAGIGLNGSIEEMPLSEFKSVFETNVFGAVRCVQAVIPSMREQKKGCIINITSVCGRITSSPLGCYSASKFALEAISEALAQELKPFNIRVGIMEPGLIDTDMTQEIAQKSLSIYPGLQRMADLFHTSLKNSTSPTLVAEKVLEFAAGDSWVLRHPVGPEALPFMMWRNSMTDEEWIKRNSLSNEAWYDAMERDFGRNVRS